MLTAILAFLAGGLVVLATGHSPVKVYQGIWEGTGLEWFFQVGSHEVGLPFSDAKVWFPWNVNDFDSIAATNLQQTLILWTTLVLTGLAVAFAFRCGLFNIGGQGQYFVGAYFAIWIGSSFVGHEQLRPHHVRRSSPPRWPGRPGPASPGSSRRRSAPTR